MHFPLEIEYPIQVYQELEEGLGQWLEVEEFTIQIPQSWTLDGNINDYKILNVGIQPAVYRESNINKIHSILVDHQTDTHYRASFEGFMKPPYSLQYPQEFNPEKYRYIFFKKKHEDSILLDIVGISKQEKKIELKITFLLQALLFECRYSEIGIRKQVEDSIENVFYVSLKKVLQYLGKINNINYENMLELTQKVVQCEELKISKQDIYSIVYKAMITIGLFPFYCEINTMNDNYLKLKLFSLIFNSEVLPWSPKYHASLVLGNFHYSFTPNDLVNQRTLKSRVYKKEYQYLRLRILDFFPLNQWIEEVANFFFENLTNIIQYIRTNLPDGARKSSMIRKQSVDQLWNSRSSILDLKEPLIREEQKETEMMQESRNSSHQSFKVDSFNFKDLLRQSIKKIENVREVYGITIKTPCIVKIKEHVASEFYDNYHLELNRNGILNHFCSIITETELRSYNTCDNNCQTPVAAFIYLLCDTFRPYSEVLYQKTTFLNACLQSGLNLLNYKQLESSYLEQNNNLVFLMDQYCKYASINEMELLSEIFIQPAVLDTSLDYFGFYSDELQKLFLKKIQKVDSNLDTLPKRRNSIFQLHKHTPEQEIKQFIECCDTLIPQKDESLRRTNKACSLDQLLERRESKVDSPQRQHSVQTSKYNMHYLMQYFQNLLLKIKIEQQKQSMYKHRLEGYLELATFLYFNSIRLQIVSKQRKNTLSYIGFVVVKDVDCLNKEPPINSNIEQMNY